MKIHNPIHFPIGHRPVHLTYRLHGSIPKGQVERMKRVRDAALNSARAEALSYPPDLGGQFLSEREFEINGQYELSFENYLHNGSNGPYHLADNKIAREIIKSYQFLHNRAEIYVYAICVMSNHVHAVVRAPGNVNEIDSGLLMSRHKSHTARKCNELLGKTGVPFWEDGYFDRTVRNGKFNTVMWYVLNNPVKAGIAKSWRDYPNCWVNPDYILLFMP